MSTWLVIVGSIWFFLAIYVGLAADDRGKNGPLWFIIVLFTGIIGLLIFVIETSGNNTHKTDSIECSECNSTNSPNSNYCSNCGEELSIECPECSSINSPKSNYCNNCGEELFNEYKNEITDTTTESVSGHSKPENESRTKSDTTGQDSFDRMVVLFSYTLMTGILGICVLLIINTIINVGYPQYMLVFFGSLLIGGVIWHLVRSYVLAENFGILKWPAEN